MTRISKFCVVSSTLAVFALSTNGAIAETVVTPKISVNPVKPKAYAPNTPMYDKPLVSKASGGTGSGKTKLGGIGSNGNRTYRKLPGTNQLNPQPLPP